MITKKICMIGAFSVGKTSLVERYVRSIFTDQYLSTVGVKISKKNVMVGEEEVALVLWDMEGKDDYSEVNLAYLRGAMGFFVVCDGMRRETLDIACSLRDIATGMVGEIPNMVLLNKADLEPSWEVKPEDLDRLDQLGIQYMKTSAKTGMSVNEAFLALAEKMLHK